MSRAMTRASGAEPPRLASRDDRAGRLLREAEQAFRSHLSADRAWKRFQVRRRRRWLARFAVLAAAAIAVVLFTRHRLATRGPNDAPILVAEQMPAPQPNSVPGIVVEQRRISPPPSPSARARPPLRAPSLLAPSSHSAVAPLADPLTDATCRAWASQAHPERAVDCYQTIARDSDIGAEVALYEAARLSAEALGDAPRALALLEQHSARFPNSVLRVEVQWLKIRSLERAGRHDEALSESEALLDSPAGRTLAPKLHLLRARIYAGARNECGQALPEYVALLGEPGPAGDEAEFSRARCLEQLHRLDEARAAYQGYLDRPDAHSAEAARIRLNAISNSAQPSTDAHSAEGQP